jgi:hypothetical protein
MVPGACASLYRLIRECANLPTCGSGYKCDVSPDGGNTWQTAQVTKNVPGAILGLSAASDKDFPLNMQVPAYVSQSTVYGV